MSLYDDLRAIGACRDGAAWARDHLPDATLATIRECWSPLAVAYLATNGGGAWISWALHHFGQVLTGADMRGVDLGGADMRGADMRGAVLSGADLGGADLRGANLGDANLGDANLGGAYLGGAYRPEGGIPGWTPDEYGRLRRVTP